MASYNDTVLTNNGISLLNRVLAGECTITFTRAVSSIADYSGKTLSELQALTSLASIEQNGMATRFDVRSKTMVSIDLLFTNKDLQNGYEIKTIGLYAQASDSSTEVLYAVATASDPETMPAYVDQKLAKFTLTLYTKVGQADKTSITITDEGVVKSINGTLTPDVNGDVTIDDSSHAKFIEAELINGHLLIPLVDDNGNPVTDPAGNQLVADEYLPKSIKLGNNPAIYPGTDNTVKLPVYTQAEIDNRLEVKADLLQMEDEHDALQEQITDNTNHLGNVDNALSQHAKQIADNADHLASVDSTLSHHAEQISQATGEASYALDQISTGQILTALSDGQGGYLTDESGNALVSETRAVTSVNGNVPGADGNIILDDYYPKQAIDNRLEVKADLLQMEDEHDALQSQIEELRSLVYELRHDVDQMAMTRLTITPRRLPTTPTT